MIIESDVLRQRGSEYCLKNGSLFLCKEVAAAYLDVLRSEIPEYVKLHVADHNPGPEWIPAEVLKYRAASGWAIRWRPLQELTFRWEYWDVGVDEYVIGEDTIGGAYPKQWLMLYSEAQGWADKWLFEFKILPDYPTIKEWIIPVWFRIEEVTNE